MIDVNAVSLLARVVQLFACRHRTSFGEPYDTVGANTELVCVNNPVPAVVQRAFKEKTTSLWILDDVGHDVPICDHGVRFEPKQPSIALLFHQVLCLLVKPVTGTVLRRQSVEVIEDLGFSVWREYLKGPQPSLDMRGVSRAYDKRNG